MKNINEVFDAMVCRRERSFIVNNIDHSRKIHMHLIIDEKFYDADYKKKHLWSFSREKMFERLYIKLVDLQLNGKKLLIAMELVIRCQRYKEPMMQVDQTLPADMVLGFPTAKWRGKGKSNRIAREYSLGPRKITFLVLDWHDKDNAFDVF